MSETNRGRPTKLIVEAGEILQSLSPMRLATVYYIEDDSIETQSEIADTLNCTPSTISQHLTELSNTPISIVSRDGQPTVTPTGHKIIGNISNMSELLGTEFDSVDWHNEDDIAAVDYCLDPLPSTRGSLLFLVLHSVGVRSSVGEQIDLLKPHESIRITPIVSDVKDRQQERGVSINREKVRWQLKQLKEAGSITLDSKAVEITDKGQAQARLLEHIIQLVEETYPDESSSDESKNHSTTHIASSSEQLGQRGTDQKDGMLVSLDEFDTDSDRPGIIPAYCHQDGSEPVLPLTGTITVQELLEAAARLGEQYDGSKELELNWTLWTQTEDLTLPNYDIE